MHEKKNTIEKTKCFICKVGTLFDLLKFGTLKLLSNKTALNTSESHMYI